MKYKDLNEIHKTKMKTDINVEFEMEWEDNELMGVLLGNLPKIKNLAGDEEIRKELQNLHKVYETYDVYKTDKKQFISLVKDQIRAVKEKKPYWQGLNVWELEECLAQQKICLISGEGGIGKTYFIKKFEEELEIRKIEHLCIYGKYEKSINNIDFEEISKIAVDKRFVFVVDALNEMPETCQGELIEKIEKIKALNEYS